MISALNFFLAFKTKSTIKFWGINSESKIQLSVISGKVAGLTSKSLFSVNKPMALEFAVIRNSIIGEFVVVRTNELSVSDRNDKITVCNQVICCKLHYFFGL